MFNGVPSEQFHQFIASRSTLPLPLPLTLPLPPPSFSIHELQPVTHHQVFQSHHLLHPLHTQQADDEENEQERVAELEGMRSASEVMDPWVKEEVLALLSIRSSLGNEFSDFIWGHVSRKLAEMGYKRSAEKCKEKFEEVSKYCNNTSYGNYYRSFNELEALFEDQTPHKSIVEEEEDKMEGDENSKMDVNMEETSANETLENPIEEENPIEDVVKKPKRKKKKKYHQLELLKGFSEFVNKIMAQQEVLHKKLLEDMEKREEERVVREEAWKKKEMDKFYKEMEIRAQEQAIACDREVKIIEFLNQFTSSASPIQGIVVKDAQILNTSSSIVVPENPNSLSKPTTSTNLNTPIIIAPSQTQIKPQIPNSSSFDTPPRHNLIPITQGNPSTTTTSSTQLQALSSPNSTSMNERDDYGKRWPRDEVNSLINLRCNLQSNLEDRESTKAPLWERISQGMMELGYKRSAKKCKEKWENINKYFRKTKDANKKRPLDSKTCPYFHQLNTLYNQGRLTAPSDGSENHSTPTENHSSVTPETGLGGASQQDGVGEAIVHVNEGLCMQ
ncbi:hypothetical protein ACHQM5_027453 [Ranunculus cassubicifolius]